MARFTQQPFEFYSESTTNLDSKPTFSEEDEMSSVLDEKILDSNPDANGMSDLRRLSYDHHVDALAYREQNPFGDYVMHQPHLQSHQQHHQSQVATAVQSDATRQASHLQSSMPLYDSNSQFMRLDTAHVNAVYAQQAAWQMPRGSGSCTPTPVYDQYAQDYDASSAGAFSGGAVGPVSAINFGQMSSYRSNVFGGPGSVAMSPQSSQGWVQPGDIVDGRPAQSPSSFRPDSNMHLRRDGIRKKNARFEIPPERTLNNIDHLIQQSTNEEEIKELKQQKRLLRNRQAALDSRQRKKLHTEKLEEEKKHFTTAISDLEEALHSQQMREKELLQENNNLSTNIQHFQQYVESLRMEKDELIRVHTLETAELRKKNNILRETMDKMEQQLKSMSNTHVSHAFGTTNGYVHSEYDNMHMETGQWDEMSLVNNISLEAEGLNAPVDGGNLTINTNTNTNGHDGVTALVPAKNDKVENIFNNQNSDYPFSWNAFYMCLLFGAFIASNSSSLSSPAALPQLSDEYRAESANVLKAVLASAPGDATSAAIQHSHSSTSFGRHQFASTMAGAEMAHMSGSASAAAAAASSSSTLDNLHNNLALPSKQQENDQVFALNADQYNALTTFHDTDGHNHMDMGDKPAQPQPSNLQQALAAMRGHGNDGRTSQVYSRSLMWDRVPEKVVRDFQRMVRECGSK